jgi:hypothetical protein
LRGLVTGLTVLGAQDNDGMDTTNESVQGRFDGLGAEFFKAIAKAMKRTMRSTRTATMIPGTADPTVAIHRFLLSTCSLGADWRRITAPPSLNVL